MKQFFHEEALNGLKRLLKNEDIKRDGTTKSDPQIDDVVKGLQELKFDNVATLVENCKTYQNEELLKLYMSINKGSLSQLHRVFLTWALTNHPDKFISTSSETEVQLITAKFSFIININKHLEQIIDYCLDDKVKQNIIVTADPFAGSAATSAEAGAASAGAGVEAAEAAA